jgi:hypothetical protein
MGATKKAQSNAMHNADPNVHCKALLVAVNKCTTLMVSITARTRI